MKIKCGRVEYELNENDIVMYNGACYQLITRRVWKGFNQTVPIISKSKAIKLIKDGLLKEKKLDNPPHESKSIIYYSI